MKSLFGIIAALALVSQSASAELVDAKTRLRNATTAVRELSANHDKAIPADLLRASTCVASITLLNGGFGLGGKGGAGLAVCRTSDNSWSAPIFLNLAAGTYGFQIGFQRVELTLVFTTRDAADRLAEGNFTLSGNLGLTAGPVGRNASAGTNYSLQDAVYSYSRSKGFYVGATVEGTALYVSQETMNYSYPGKSAREVLSMKNSFRDAMPLINEIEKASR
jgi:lipid-binding SYLF domain-containing protein